MMLFSEIEAMLRKSRTPCKNTAGLAVRLREAMRKAGVRRQQDLARLVGVTPSSVSRWLNGAAMNQLAIKHVADRLGVPAEWLRGTAPTREEAGR